MTRATAESLLADLGSRRPERFGVLVRFDVPGLVLVERRRGAWRRVAEAATWGELVARAVEVARGWGVSPWT